MQIQFCLILEHLLFTVKLYCVSLCLEWSSIGFGDLALFFGWHYSCFYFSPFSQYSWRRQWHPTPVLLPGKSHGQRSLVGCSPWGRYESDTTEWLHFHFPLSCIGEGNGNPFQCSYVENPRDGGAWWAAIYGVAQSRTWLKRLSSSSTLLCCFENQMKHSFTEKKSFFMVSLWAS